MQQYGDLTGQTFGTLTVRRYESGRWLWLCTCAEGHEVLRTRNSLKRDVPCDHCEAKRLDARTADIHDRYVVKRQSLKTIATAYDVDLKTAWLWVRRAGIKTRPRGAPRGPRPASHPKCDLAVERYRNGETSVAIGRDLGVDPSSVTRWAKRAGVEPHPMGRAPRRHPVAAELIDSVVAQLNTDPPAPTPRDLVLDLHAQGVARKTIAHDLGLSVKTVGRWIADADRERVTRIRAMAHAGVPHAAIAEMFGVSCAYVGLLAREGRERAA
jgi:transposase